MDACSIRGFLFQICNLENHWRLHMLEQPNGTDGTKLREKEGRNGARATLRTSFIVKNRPDLFYQN